MIAYLQFVNSMVWGIPTMLLIIGVGLHLSVRTKFLQIRKLPYAIKMFCKQIKTSSEGEVSGYRALCVALAATVGTGNLAGVAGAIAIGGPGAIFWMWICAVFGMITKYAEAVLAIRYRKKDGNNGYISGPMYMINNGLPPRYGFLGYVYCFLGVIASFGVGNATQINTVICSVETVFDSFGISFNVLFKAISAIIICFLVVWLLLGGAKRVGQAAEVIVPFAAVSYLLLGGIVLVLKYKMIPFAFQAIIKGAFMPQAVTGGVVGSMLSTMRVGASRGVFTNEAGMGTAAIAHGAANVKHPVQQGLMGIVEVFIDTILICTITGLVILCSGIPIPYGIDTGISLSADAFSSVCGTWINIPLTFIVCVLAFATILGWSLYGIRCGQYLFGEKVLGVFVVLQGVVSLLGVCLNTSTVWIFSEIVNGLMAIPNLFALAFLTPELLKITNDYFVTKNDCPGRGNRFQKYQ